MKQGYFYLFWHTVNLLVALSLVFLFCGIAWEYSTRSYLRGFSDAVVPVDASPEQKIEAILTWMAHGPARHDESVDGLAQRDPEETLNYAQLLRVCGSATNAFVNLSSSSGLTARRLLLLSPDRGVKHVVAEVLLDGRWVVVDPGYRVLFRDTQGKFLTKEQLRNPYILRQATLAVPDYPLSYSYEQTAIIRLRKLPLIGRWLRPALNRLYPKWEDDFDWTLVVERESFAFLLISALLFAVLALARIGLAWYCDHHLGFPRTRLRKRFMLVGTALLSGSR